MEEEDYIIAVDEGTSDTRAIVFDLKGNAVSEGRGTYGLLKPKPGWVEQKAEWWWDAFKNATIMALKRARIDPKKIRAVGITHQRATNVPVDENIKPLRNSINWTDARSIKQVKWVKKNIGAKKIYERTGYPPSVVFPIYKAMWIKDNEPQIFKKIYKWLGVFDYLVYKLTGNISTTSGSSTTTGCLDITKPTNWATDIMEACGIPAETWPKILPPVVEAGSITKEAAKETGICEGLPVITAAGDQPCGCLGAGAAKLGRIGVNGGTSLTFETVTPKLHFDPNMSFFIEYNPIGSYAPEGSIMGGQAAMMNWFRDNFAYQEITIAKKRNIKVWDIIDKEAAEAPAGCLGLITIPYWKGTLQPYWDPGSRGIMLGFGLAHKKKHFIRSLMEGLAFELRRNIDLMEKGLKHKITELRMYGGCSRSDIWNQIFADVISRPVLRTQTPETTTLGAAICAAVGEGIYGSMRKAIENMVHVKKKYEPNLKNQKIYEKLYSRVYIDFYDRVSDLVHKTSELTDYYP